MTGHYGREQETASAEEAVNLVTQLSPQPWKAGAGSDGVMGEGGVVGTWITTPLMTSLRSNAIWVQSPPHLPSPLALHHLAPSKPPSGLALAPPLGACDRARGLRLSGGPGLDGGQERGLAHAAGARELDSSDDRPSGNN